MDRATLQARAEAATRALARAKARAAGLRGPAGRAAILAAASDAAEALDALKALRGAVRDKLRAVRTHSRRHRAYASAARLRPPSRPDSASPSDHTGDPS